MTDNQIKAAVEKAEDSLAYAKMISLEAEVEKIRIRRQARRIVEMEERMNVAAPPIDEVSASLYAPLPNEPPDLIPGVLPRGGVTGIVGETNVGKSLLALEISSSMVTGNPLWGLIKPTNTVKRVVYFLGEHSKRTLQELFHLTKLPHEGDLRLIGPEDLANGMGKGVVVNGVVQQKVVDWYSELAEGAGLIVFDPISAFVQGAESENDNTIMRTLIGAFGLVAERNDAACIALSHMGKPRIDQNGQAHQRTSYAMRGASSQEDALTHVFYFRCGRVVNQQLPTYELYSRKFKGQSDKGCITLVRDNFRHTMLDGPRPTSQAKQLHTVDRFATLLSQFPEMSKNQLVHKIAGEQNVDPRTVWRRLEEANPDFTGESSAPAEDVQNVSAGDSTDKTVY